MSKWDVVGEDEDLTHFVGGIAAKAASFGLADYPHSYRIRNKDTGQEKIVEARNTDELGQIIASGNFDQSDRSSTNKTSDSTKQTNMSAASTATNRSYYSAGYSSSSSSTSSDFSAIETVFLYCLPGILCTIALLSGGEFQIEGAIASVPLWPLVFIAGHLGVLGLLIPGASDPMLTSAALAAFAGWIGIAIVVIITFFRRKGSI